MPVPPDEIYDLLHRLAQRFEDAVQTLPGDITLQGWGQFLDAPKLHEQVGFYGTSAGLIVLALADRQQSNPAKKAVETLTNWWNNRDQDDYGRKRFAQTLRVAFLHLAARLSPVLAPMPEAAAVRENLLARLLPSHSWGNFWLNPETHDATPRPFVTAITLLSFTLFESPDKLCPKLRAVADALERTFLGSDSRPLYEQVALAAAILSAKGPATNPKAIAKIGALARTLPQDFADQPVYFFDYEHPPQAKKKSICYGRDYLIISPELFLGIAGFQPGAPTTLRLRAEAVIEALVSHCKAHDHAFRPAPGERLTTMNQAWCAILLKLYLASTNQPTRRSRIWYAAVRSRSDNTLTRIILPLLAVAVVTVGLELLHDAARWQRAIGGLCMLLITSMYGRRLLNKGLAPLIGTRHDNV